MAGERAVSASPVLCFVFSIVTDVFSFFHPNLYFQELFVLLYYMSVHKISRTNGLIYYATTATKSPCNTVLITVLPGALFLFRSNYFYKYRNIAYYFFLTITLSRCQISSTYSWIVLSDVNLPLHAVLRSAFLAQPFSSLYAASTRFCASA